MSEEMAVSDNTTGDEASVANDEAAEATEAVAVAAVVAPEEPVPPAAPEVEEPAPVPEEPLPAEPIPEPADNIDKPPEIPAIKEEPGPEDVDLPAEPGTDLELKPEVYGEAVIKDEIETFEHNVEEDYKKGIKRRASEAFSDPGDEEFKGFLDVKQEIPVENYSRVLERLEAEVTAATKTLVPLRTVMAAPGKASKRPRKDTDGSRPSSALSSRSEGDGATDASAASSPAQRGRRATTEMSSPLLRVPLERGWKRELVYRAALDAHSRRNADIYYYTPQGKKLRSTREVAEHLAGTGLTLDNFSFFKEPLGVDDPEKEIIRDAKLIRRVESPIAATVPATVEGKRTPKPKPAKGASPEPVTPAQPAKSPPAKIKVKSMGSRLSSSTPATTPITPATKQQKKQPQQNKDTNKEAVKQETPSSNADNNNSASWKKPSPPGAGAALSRGECSDVPVRTAATASTASTPATPAIHRPASGTATTAHPTASTPPPPLTPHNTTTEQSPRQLVQPCSMSCGRGAVPSLSCAACLCLYHPACAGYVHAPPDPFFCKNCRKSSSPPHDPPPLTHKSGITTSSIPVPVPVPVPVPAPVPRRVPVPVPVPVPAKVPRDKRVLLRMKVAGGTPDGERVWAVAGTHTHPPPTHPSPVIHPTPTRTRAPRPALPQGLAILNGRRFVVVPRNMVHAAAQQGGK